MEGSVIERGRSCIRIAGVKAAGPMPGRHACHTQMLGDARLGAPPTHMGCIREAREAYVGQDREFAKCVQEGEEFVLREVGAGRPGGIWHARTSDKQQCRCRCHSQHLHVYSKLASNTYMTS